MPRRSPPDSSPATSCTQNKNLYYLNALSLLTVANIPFAKTVCLDGCPTQDNVCAFGSLPCTNNTQLL